MNGIFLLRPTGEIRSLADGFLPGAESVLVAAYCYACSCDDDYGNGCGDDSDGSGYRVGGCGSGDDRGSYDRGSGKRDRGERSRGERDRGELSDGERYRDNPGGIDDDRGSGERYRGDDGGIDDGDDGSFGGGGGGSCAKTGDAGHDSTPPLGLIAPYTRAGFYGILRKELRLLGKRLFKRRGGSFRMSVNGRLPEKRIALAAGVGVPGRNGLVISRDWGSLIVLGVLVGDLPVGTDDLNGVLAELEAEGSPVLTRESTGGGPGASAPPERPALAGPPGGNGPRGHCAHPPGAGGVEGPPVEAGSPGPQGGEGLQGSPDTMSPGCLHCGACVRACPTGALDGPRLDRDRCIQALSAVDRVLPVEVMRKWGRRLYGCSTCQDVCPMNAHVTWHRPLPERGRIGPSLPVDLVLHATGETFRRMCAGNQLSARWVSFDALRRNALLVLASYGPGRFDPVFRRLSRDPSPTVSGTARAILEGVLWNGRKTAVSLGRHIEPSDATKLP